MKKMLVVIVAVFFALGVVGMSIAATKKSSQEEFPADVKASKTQKQIDQKTNKPKDAKPGLDKDKSAKPGQLKDKGVKPGQLKDKVQKAPAAEQKANTVR